MPNGSQYQYVPQYIPTGTPVVVVSGGAGATEKQGMGTGTKILLLLLLLGGIGIAVWWLLSSGKLRYDCTGVKHIPTEVCWPNTEEKIPGTKNCCHCRLILSLNPFNPYSSAYECGHYWG